MEQKGATFNGKHYLNPVPTDVMKAGSMKKVLLEYMKPHPGRVPVKPPGPFATDKAALLRLADNDVQVTWLGHSTVLLTVDGKRF